MFWEHKISSDRLAGIYLRNLRQAVLKGISARSKTIWPEGKYACESEKLIVVNHPCAHALPGGGDRLRSRRTSPHECEHWCIIGQRPEFDQLEKKRGNSRRAVRKRWVWHRSGGYHHRQFWSYAPPHGWRRPGGHSKCWGRQPGRLPGPGFLFQASPNGAAARRYNRLLTRNPAGWEPFLWPWWCPGDRLALFRSSLENSAPSIIFQNWDHTSNWLHVLCLWWCAKS